ncbi:MAG: hypothetical protein V1807_02525 [Patescibacteria group bacterium]
MKKSRPSLSTEALAVILLVLVSAGLTWANTTNNTVSSAVTWPGMTSDTFTIPSGINTDNTTSSSTSGCCSKRVVNGKTSGICVKGTGCPSNNQCSNIGGACSNYSGSGGSGGSGGGTTPTPSTPTTPTPTPVDPDHDGKHWACVPVSYGTIAYKCVEVNGEAEDTCGEEKGPCLNKPAGTPADYYYTCRANKCVAVANIPGQLPGRSSCSSDTDCTKNVFTSVGNSIGNFFGMIWSTVLSWFGR